MLRQFLKFVKRGAGAQGFKNNCTVRIYCHQLNIFILHSSWSAFIKRKYCGLTVCRVNLSIASRNYMTAWRRTQGLSLFMLIIHWDWIMQLRMNALFKGFQQMSWLISRKIARILEQYAQHLTRHWGLVRDLNPGPLAPKARIIPLDQRATNPVIDMSIFEICQTRSRGASIWEQLNSSNLVPPT